MTNIPIELFTDLKNDKVQVDETVLANAKTGNGAALFAIGLEYYRLQHSRASNWFYLSTTRGSHNGYFFLGLMYHFGTGVSVDYLYAIEAYLNAAKHDTRPAFIKIGDLFNEGLGVSMNKYKALEWYSQDSIEFSQTKTFTENKLVLKDQDKNKSIELLIKETEDIINAEKARRQNISNITAISNSSNNNNTNTNNNNNTTTTSNNNKGANNNKQDSTLGDQLKSKVEEVNKLRSDLEKQKQQFSHIELEKELQQKRNVILDNVARGLRENISKLQAEMEALRQRLNKQTETESDRLNTTRKTDSILKLNQSLEKEAKYTKDENITLKRSIRNLEHQLEDKKGIISNLRKQTVKQTPDEKAKSLQDENALLRESNGDLEEHLISKIQDIAAKEDENQLLNKTVSELERKLIGNEDEIQNISNENKMLKQKINNAEEQLMGKERETGSIKDENRLLKESVKYLEQRLNNKSEETKKLADENNSLTKSIQDLEHQLKAIADTKREGGARAMSEREIRRLKDENAALKQVNSRLDRQLTDKEKECRVSKDENRLLKKSNENLDREVYNNENKIKSMELQIKQKDNHISNLKKDNSNTNHLQKLKDENIELTKKLNKCETEMNALKGEKKALGPDPQMTNRMLETMDSLLKARTNEMELLKQNMSFLLEKEMEKTSRLELENAALKEGLYPPPQLEPPTPTSTYKADDFLVAKTEENVENMKLPSCQISNKKRRMTPTTDA